jgi:hypothetical protein
LPSLRLAIPLVVLLGSLACVSGNTDPGTVPKDNCRLRDCGPVSGGNNDADPELDSDEPPPDDSEPPVDSTTLEDTATTDTAKPPETGGCTVPSGKTCTTIPQCGCASGTNCDVTALDGKTACVAAGSKMLHEKCTDLGQCAKGLSCVFGLCVPFCRDAADCTSAECRPVQYSDDAGVKDIPDFKTCEPQCDLVNPSKACGASASCDLLDIATGKTTCISAGSGTTAASCKTDAFACAPGYTCVGTDCRRWCRVGFPGDCPTGKSCQSFSDHPTISGIEYGVCTY